MILVGIQGDRQNTDPATAKREHFRGQIEQFLLLKTV